MSSAKITNCNVCDVIDKTRKTRGFDEHLCLKCAKARRNFIKQCLSIRDPKEAREAYELSRLKGKSKVSLPDYDVLYAEFKSDCNSFTELAIRYSFSRERIRQIYMRFFSAHIPRRPNGLTRQKVCTLKRRVSKKTLRQEQLLTSPVIMAFKLAIEPLGLVIKVISNKRGRGIPIVSIAGKGCVFYICNNAYQTRPNSKIYWSFPLNFSILKDMELLICVALDNEKFRFFIIPTYELSSKFFEAGIRPLYIPQGGYDLKGRGWKVDSFDVFQFENAWHLLKPPVSPSPA